MARRKLQVNQTKTPVKSREMTLPAKKKTASVKQQFMCMRCRKLFKTRQALKIHSRTHTQSLSEIRMLQDGYVPKNSKIGSSFKGKNKIIVS